MWPTVFNNFNSQTMMNNMYGLMNSFFGNTGAMNSFCMPYTNPAYMYGYPNAESYMTPTNTLYNMVSDNFNLIAKYNNTFYPSIYGGNTMYNSGMTSTPYYYYGVPTTGMQTNTNMFNMNNFFMFFMNMFSGNNNWNNLLFNPAFLTINKDSNQNISKEELAAYLQENFGLKEDANENLKDYVLTQLIEEISLDDDGEINIDEFRTFIDKNENGIIDNEDLEEFNAKMQLNADVLNDADEWQADNDYGLIDWNHDGTFGNDGTAGNNVSDWHESLLAVHGDLDAFFKGFGQNYKISNLEALIENNDGSNKDKDSREDFVSNGKVTAHKISDTQIGFSITEHDQSASAGVDYNYVVWDQEKNAYIIGNDENNDGNLTEAEIFGIIENVGKTSKTSSPLVFDLDGDGVETTGINKKFDINGDGKIDNTAWAGKDDGVLAFDADGDGIVGEDGKELFGNNTDVNGDGKADGHNNGFEALKALAEKYLGLEATADNKLDAKEIKELEEKAKLTMLVGDTQKSLTELGITEISLGYEEIAINKSKDKNGNEHRQVGNGFVINGSESKVDDVWFKYNELV